VRGRRPEYPEISVERREEGTVVLELSITTDGRVLEGRVAEIERLCTARCKRAEGSLGFVAFMSPLRMAYQGLDDDRAFFVEP